MCLEKKEKEGEREKEVNDEKDDNDNMMMWEPETLYKRDGRGRRLIRTGRGG